MQLNALGAALAEESWTAVAVVDTLGLGLDMKDLLASSKIPQPVMLSMASSNIAHFRRARRWVARELTVA